MLQSTVRTPRASEINNESPSVVSAGTAEEKLVPSSESAAVAFDTTLGHIITYAAGGPVSGCRRLAQNLTLSSGKSGHCRGRAASHDGVRHDIRGKRNGLSVYKGVPFAAPPVGDLRWRPPMPAAPWIGTRKADAFAPACMQVGVSMPGETPPVVSEDCLYLNIWTPGKDRARAPAGDRLDLRRRIHQRVGLDALVLGRPARATKASSLSPSLIALVRLVFLRFLS
jgi:hypothetical protein